MKPYHACAWLQNKSYFCGGAPKEDQDDYWTPFWCLKTHDAVGPDGREAGERACTADRPCFRPEVEL